MPIKFVNGNFLDSTEKYICVVCNCIETKVNKEIEPMVSQVYEQFPFANIYHDRKTNGKRGKPGSIEIKGNGQTERFVINILSQFYAGHNNFPNDNSQIRLAWFKKALAQLSDQNHLESISLSQQMIEDMCNERDWDSYMEIIEDFEKLLKLKSRSSVNIIIYEKPKEKIDDKEYIRIDNVDEDMVLTIGNFRHLNIRRTTKPKITPSTEQSNKEVENKTEDVDNKTNQVDIEEDKLEETTIQEAKEDEKHEDGMEENKTWDENPDWTCQISELPGKVVGWNEIFIDSNIQEELRLIDDFFVQEMATFGDFIKIYPPQHLIFNAFQQAAFSDLKVCIIGQDPYINEGEAMGLSFSVPKGVKVPPSLQNIYKELEKDIAGFKIPQHGDLSSWAKQGVLLLNTSLTVRHKKSGSHMKVWKNFTDRIIKLISEKSQHPLMFLLWGLPAKRKQNLINTEKHIIFTASHPSPLSANKGGWFGNGHFSKVNDKLKELNLDTINWQT